jgi:hypothetical protein
MHAAVYTHSITETNQHALTHSPHRNSIMAAGKILVALALASGAAADVMQRVEVNSSCLDGTPYSFYISTGTEPTKFHFYHQVSRGHPPRCDVGRARIGGVRSRRER